MKIQINCSGSIDYYVTEQISATDYYPFGAAMPGRNFSSDKYRYGFNGKENDNEVKGQGNSLDFDARIYDPRLGRTLSQDPHASKYPSLSPYSMFNNNPIIYIDKTGKDFTYSVEIIKDKSGTPIRKVIHVDVQVKVLNLTKETLNPTDFSSAESKGHSVYDFETTSAIADKKGNVTMIPTTVDVSTTFTIAKNSSEVKPGENLMLVVDQIQIKEEGNWAGLATLDGNVSAVESNYINKGGWAQLVLHELAHNLGIEDNYSKSSKGIGLMGTLSTKGGSDGNFDLNETQKKNMGMHSLSGKGVKNTGGIKDKAIDFVKYNTKANPNDKKLK